MRAQNRVMYWYITLFNSMHRYITCLYQYIALFNSMHRHITRMHRYIALFALHASMRNSYVSIHGKFCHARSVVIWSYLLNRSSDSHDLGLFGNGRERSTTFMFNKISFEASLMLESQVEGGPKTCHFWKLSITGHFPFLETFALTSKSSRYMFGMTNEPLLNMIEVLKIISPPHSPQLTA